MPKSIQTASWGAIGAVGAVAVWQVTAIALGASNFPTAASALSRLWEEFGEGHFWTSLGTTLEQWLVGLGITLAIGLPLGLLIGQSRVADRYTHSSIDFFRSIPPIILLPLFVLIFGTSLKMVSLVTLYGTVWPIMIHTIAGAQNVSAEMHDTARTFRLGRWRTFWFVVLPGAGPFIITGLRIGGAIALFIVVAAQLVGNAPGIGRDIAVAQLNGEVRLVYALIFVSGVLGVVVNVGLQVIERIALPGQRVSEVDAR